MVRISQQLDSYIVELQSRQAAKRRDQ
ncbi:hypothetical protein L3476_27850 [Paenibacillus thiaminolyticus]|nr:hypothetical protein [Paenibacillus thiaminolyticus]WCR30149.1 hypothetical protein L3476_27850 [Paenibacillus thiaminolyticus]